jgi:cytochrome c-type biogenesis protein CcmH
MTAWILRSVSALVIVLAAMLPAAAVQPDEVLDNPVLEQRARDISAGLRCLVCQNQSIDDSEADLARDLRLLVRQRLLEGDSDEEVVDYVVSRYGEFVLLKPRLETKTILLWSTPAVLLLLGLTWLVLSSRQRRMSPASAPLSEKEKKEIQRLLSRGDESS